jgi:hypothetical protein
MKGRTMPIGTVKFFNEQKGFGFIAPEGAVMMLSSTSAPWSNPG